MRKYIIEIDDALASKFLHIPGVLCFEGNELGKLTPYDESAVELQGAEKAWKFCRFLREECDYGKVYGMGLTDIMDMSYQDARAKYEAWQKKEAEIKVGDEVRCGNVHGIVLQVTEKSITVIIANGYVSITDDKQEWKKTGRHFPAVAELLKKIGGNE